MVRIKRYIGTGKRSINILLLFCLTMFLSACNDGSCPTVQDYFNRGIESRCIICGLFDILTDTSAQAANASWNKFSPQLITLVVLASAIFIAMTILKSLGSFTKQNAADILTNSDNGLIFYLFKSAFIVLLLKTTFLISNIILPILTAGLEIGSFLTVVSAPPIPAGGGGSWDNLFSLVNQYAAKFNNGAYKTVAIGQALICNATNYAKWWIFSWEWLMLTYGLLLYLFGWFFLIGISFYIVDIIINLTFGAVLLPFGVACVISKFTSSYSKNIWNVFLNAFFSFVMLGIMVGISMQLVSLGMTEGDIDSNSERIAASGGQALNSFLTNMEMLVNENNVKEISRGLWQSGSLILTIISLCVAVKLTAQMKKIAGKLSGGFITGAGSTALTQVSGMAIVPTKSLALAGVHRYGPKMVDSAKYRFKNSKVGRFAGAVGDGVSRFRGYTTGTGKYGSNAFWR